MIQHVAVEVAESDVDACVAFYSLLSFVSVDPPVSLADRTAWLQSGSTQVHLMFASEPVVPPEGHLAVVVPDYEGTIARLREAGHDPEPRPEHWGSPRSFVRDPAGHRVEVMAFGPDPG